MPRIGLGFLDSRLFAQGLRRWARTAREADRAELPQLRQHRVRARALKAHLDRVIHTADARLALPMIGSNSFPRPHNADWSWRPDLWRGPLPTRGVSPVDSKCMLGDEVTLFHDCTTSELTLRQVRNLRAADLAPFGLQLDVLRFDGSFLSIVVDLPQSALAGLKRTHLFRMDAIIEAETPIGIFSRLNVKHGPNTEKIVRDLPRTEQHHKIEFDLSYTNLNERRADKAWIDIILGSPQMNQITLRDLTLSRRPRAEV